MLKLIAASLPALLLSSFYISYASQNKATQALEIDESEWGPYRDAQEHELKRLKLNQYVNAHFRVVGNSTFDDAKIVFLIDTPINWKVRVQHNLIAGHLSRVFQTMLLEESSDGGNACLNGWFNTVRCEPWDYQREFVHKAVTRKGASLEDMCSELNIDSPTYLDLKNYFEGNRICLDKGVVFGLARHRSMIRQIKRWEKTYQKIFISGKIGNVPHSEVLVPDERAKKDIAFVTQRILKEMGEIPYVTLIPR